MCGFEKKRFEGCKGRFNAKRFVQFVCEYCLDKDWSLTGLGRNCFFCAVCALSQTCFGGRVFIRCSVVSKQK